MSTIDDLQAFLDTYVPSEAFAHDALAWRVCELAYAANRHGTYGVGTMLMDETGRVVAEGHNRVYVGGYRSDLHAEMVVMNGFEQQHAERQDLSTYTLLSSLEPCPMCMTRPHGNSILALGGFETSTGTPMIPDSAATTPGSVPRFSNQLEG